MKPKGFHMNSKQKIWTLAALMALATACKKDPIPTSEPTPDPITTDTITPPTGDTITPPPSGDTIVPPTPVGDTAVLWVFINYENQTLKYPTMDTLRKLVNDDQYQAINLKWGVPPNRTSCWHPGGFVQPRDSLRVRFALSPKIFGSEKIYVNENYGGASIPCEDSLTLFKLGMTKCDSAIFANWGYEVVRCHQEKSNINTITSTQEIWNMNRAILE